MHIYEFYPQFTFQDDWNRILKYQVINGKYYRTWMNTPKGFTQHQARKEITKQQFAYGLLCAIEKEVIGINVPIKDVPVEAPKELQSELDKFFGPQKAGKP